MDITEKIIRYALEECERVVNRLLQDFCDALEVCLNSILGRLPYDGWEQDLQQFYDDWERRDLSVDPDSRRDLHVWIASENQRLLAERQRRRIRAILDSLRTQSVQDVSRFFTRPDWIPRVLHASDALAQEAAFVERKDPASTPVAADAPQPVYGPITPAEHRRQEEEKRRAEHRAQLIRRALIEGVLNDVRRILATDRDYQSLLYWCKRLRRPPRTQLALEVAFMLDAIRRELARLDGNVLRGDQSPPTDSGSLTTPDKDYPELRQLHEAVRQAFHELGLDDVQFEELNAFGLPRQFAGAGLALAIKNARRMASFREQSPAIHPVDDDIELALLLSGLGPLGRALAGIGRRTAVSLLTRVATAVGTRLLRRATIDVAEEAVLQISRQTAREILQSLVDSAVARLTQNPALASGVLTGPEYAFGRAAKGFPRQFGNAVQALVLEDIEKDAALKLIFRTKIAARNQLGRYVSVPDFFGIGTAQGYIFEITTTAGRARHLGRWYGDLAEYILYDIPAGLTAFP